MGRRLAAALGAAVGSTVEVHLPGRAAPERLRVAGVLESGDEDEGRMFVAGAPSPGGPRYTYALLSVPGGEAALAGMGAAIAGLGLELSPLRQVLHGEQAVIARIDLLTGIALAVVVLLGALGVTAAVLARVLERRRELALLQALGATRRSVATFLLCEGAVTGAVAAVLGYAAGTALSRAVARQVFGVAPAPHLAPLLAAAAVSVVIAVAAAAVGARRALRLETAALLKGE
jgi:putative ABC transport system permease protein